MIAYWVRVCVRVCVHVYTLACVGGRKEETEVFPTDVTINAKV